MKLTGQLFYKLVQFGSARSAVVFFQQFSFPPCFPCFQRSEGVQKLGYACGAQAANPNLKRTTFRRVQSNQLIDF